jgi:hypothetical protein
MMAKFSTLIILVLNSACLGQEGKYAFSISLKDEDGRPVQNAVVEHAFHSHSISEREQFSRKVTDGAGVCDFSGKAWDLGHVRVLKEGYYATTEKPSAYLRRHWNTSTLSLSDWMPMDRILELEIKAKGKPVPMYAKNEKIRIPTGSVGKKIGYDLETGDWVKPYGKGEIADFIFSLEISGSIANDVRWKVLLEFSNPNDGILALSSQIGSDNAAFRGSELRSPTKAPLGDYLPRISWQNSELAPQERGRDNIYIFRIRTKVDESGNIKQAFYGKMYDDPFLGRAFKNENGELVVDFDVIWFCYYFNPDQSRNLEFDTSANRFDFLSLEHSVLRP